MSKFIVIALLLIVFVGTSIYLQDKRYPENVYACRVEKKEKYMFEDRHADYPKQRFLLFTRDYYGSKKEDRPMWRYIWLDVNSNTYYSTQEGETANFKLRENMFAK